MLPSKPLYLQTVAEIDIVTSQETLFSYYAELTFDLMSMPLTASPQHAYPIATIFIKKTYRIYYCREWERHDKARAGRK